MIKFLRYALWLPLLLVPRLLLAEPAFYELKKEGQTLWLMGSIHAGTESLYPLPAVITSRWQQSRQLVVEVDLNSVPPDEIARMGTLTRLPSGQTLKSVLDPALYQRTQEAAATWQVPMQALDQLKPWSVALTLTQAAMVRSGFSPDLGVDSHFLASAHERQLPVVGLEGFSEQLGYLASVEPYQSAMLQSTLDELTDFRQSFNEVMNAWQNNDSKRLAALLKEELGPPELQTWLEQTLLIERNQRWLQKIPALPDRSFVVVGALHLYGPHGLLSALKQKGYTLHLLTSASKSAH